MNVNSAITRCIELISTPEYRVRTWISLVIVAAFNWVVSLKPISIAGRVDVLSLRVFAAVFTSGYGKRVCGGTLGRHSLNDKSYLAIGLEMQKYNCSPLLEFILF